MLLPMRQGAITGRKETTLVMRENVLPQSGGYCNVWGSVKTNRPSVNKYANLTWRSSCLLDLDNDI